MSKNIQHIAVIRLSAMGDVAMTVPVLRALSKQHPQIKITMVSRPFFKPFFEGIPNLTFFEVDVNQRHKGFLGLYRLYEDLKKLQIDAFIDLHNVLRSRIVGTFFKLNGYKTAVVDKARDEKKALVRAEKKIFKPLTSIINRHVSTFESVGISINLKEFKFPEKANLSQEILNISGVKSQNWIGIAPFAQYESKVYPQDLMQKVINSLAANPNNKIFLFGGGNREKELLESMVQSRNNVVNLAGKIPFQDELHLISNLDVMLSMDSGNAHIAAMLGIKVVSVWGATHPFAGFAPFNQPTDYSITSDRNLYPLLPTSIYGNKKVKGYEDVMRSIAPETIVQKIESIL